MPENIYNPLPDCQIPGLEWIYCGVFGLKHDGVFVEVGAHDGRSWSNTAFLADLGWRGLYIEPMHHLAVKCRQNHADNNVEVVEEVVGTGDSVTIYKNTGTDYLYTGNPDFAKLNDAKGIVGEFGTIRLDYLLHLKDIPEAFDLLVIDVEGMEVDVLKGFTILDWMPALVIIETHELNPNAEMAERTGYINEYFFLSGLYVKIYTSAINTIYVRI